MHACYELYTEQCKAGTIGDPHFVTVGGNLYTFNGGGEFWFLKAANLSIQVRILQTPPSKIFISVLYDILMENLYALH